MLIFSRSDCICTASGTVTPYERPYIKLVKRELPLNQCNVRPLIDSDGRARAEPDGTRAETTFRLSPKRTSPFKSAGESVQSTAGSRGVRISVTNAGYTTSRSRVRVLATNSIRQFPL